MHPASQLPTHPPRLYIALFHRLQGVSEVVNNENCSDSLSDNVKVNKQGEKEVEPTPEAVARLLHAQFGLHRVHADKSALFRVTRAADTWEGWAVVSFADAWRIQAAPHPSFNVLFYPLVPDELATSLSALQWRTLRQDPVPTERLLGLLSDARSRFSANSSSVRFPVDLPPERMCIALISRLRRFLPLVLAYLHRALTAKLEAKAAEEEDLRLLTVEEDGVDDELEEDGEVSMPVRTTQHIAAHFAFLDDYLEQCAVMTPLTLTEYAAFSFGLLCAGHTFLRLYRTHCIMVEKRSAFESYTRVMRARLLPVLYRLQRAVRDASLEGTVSAIEKLPPLLEDKDLRFPDMKKLLKLLPKEPRFEALWLSEDDSKSSTPWVGSWVSLLPTTLKLLLTFIGDFAEHALVEFVENVQLFEQEVEQLASLQKWARVRQETFEMRRETMQLIVDNTVDRMTRALDNAEAAAAIAAHETLTAAVDMMASLQGCPLAFFENASYMSVERLCFPGQKEHHFALCHVQPPGEVLGTAASYGVWAADRIVVYSTSKVLSLGSKIMRTAKTFHLADLARAVHKNAVQPVVESNAAHRLHSALRKGTKKADRALGASTVARSLNARISSWFRKIPAVRAIDRAVKRGIDRRERELQEEEEAARRAKSNADPSAGQ